MNVVNCGGTSMPGRVQLRTVFPLRSRLLWVAGNPFEVGPVDPDSVGSSD